MNLLVSFSACAELVWRYLLEVTNTVNPSSIPGLTLKNRSNCNLTLILTLTLTLTLNLTTTEFNRDVHSGVKAFASAFVLGTYHCVLTNLSCIEIYIVVVAS